MPSKGLNYKEKTPALTIFSDINTKEEKPRV